MIPLPIFPGETHEEIIRAEPTTGATVVLVVSKRPGHADRLRLFRWRVSGQRWSYLDLHAAAWLAVVDAIKEHAQRLYDEEGERQLRRRHRHKESPRA